MAGLLLPRGTDWRFLFVGVGVCSGLLLLLYLGCHLPAPEAHERVTRKRLLAMMRTWSFFTPCLAIFLYVLSESTIVVYANLYLRRAHAAPENWAIYSIAFFWGSMLIGRAVCALLPEHHSYEKTIAVILGASALVMSLQVVVSDWRTSMVLFALAGLILSGGWPLIVALASSRAPNHAASLVGLTISVGAFGCIAAPPLMNVLMNWLPLRLVYVATALPLLLGAVTVMSWRNTATAGDCP